MQSKHLDCWHVKKVHLVMKVIFCLSNKCLFSGILLGTGNRGKKTKTTTHTHKKKNSEQMKMRKLSSCCLQTSERDI